MCHSRTWSNTGASRSSSQRGQSFLPWPWLLIINCLETICRHLVWHSPKSSAMSHSFSHPPFFATSAICGAFSSHSSILFFLSSCPITFFTSCMHTDLVSNSTYDPFCEVSPKSLLYSSLYSLTRHNELTSSTIDSIAAAPTPVAVSESVLFRNPSFLNSNLDLADSISRAVTAAVLEWCFVYLSALFANSPKQPSAAQAFSLSKSKCVAWRMSRCIAFRREDVSKKYYPRRGLALGLFESYDSFRRLKADWEAVTTADSVY